MCWTNSCGEENIMRIYYMVTVKPSERRNREHGGVEGYHASRPIDVLRHSKTHWFVIRMSDDRPTRCCFWSSVSDRELVLNIFLRKNKQNNVYRNIILSVHAHENLRSRVLKNVSRNRFRFLRDF